MGQTIKQIAIFNKNKEEGASSGEWEIKQIGTTATNVSLDSPIYGINTNLSTLLGKILPQQALASGFIESDNGKLQNSQYSDAIIDFFKDEEDGGLLATLLKNVAQNNKKPTRDQIQELLEQYVDEGSTIIPRLTPVQVGNLVYPVGSVYISFKSDDPTSFLGGVWERLGRSFLLPAAENEESEQTGGASEQTINIPLKMTQGVAIANHEYIPSGNIGELTTSGNYGLTTVSSVYKNQVIITKKVPASTSQSSDITFSGTKVQLDHSITQPVFEQAESITINTMPPYTTVYMWRRKEIPDNVDMYYGIGAEDFEIHIVDNIEEKVANYVFENSDDLLTEATKTKWKTILGIS